MYFHFTFGSYYSEYSNKHCQSEDCLLNIHVDSFSSFYMFWTTATTAKCMYTTTGYQLVLLIHESRVSGIHFVLKKTLLVFHMFWAAQTHHLTHVLLSCAFRCCARMHPVCQFEWLTPLTTGWQSIFPHQGCSGVNLFFIYISTLMLILSQPEQALLTVSAKHHGIWYYFQDNDIQSFAYTSLLIHIILNLPVLDCIVHIAYYLWPV